MTDDIEKLEKFLRGVKSPVLSGDSRARMKNSLVKSISQDEKVIDYVRASAEDVSISNLQKVLLKERLMSYISSGRSFVWGQLFSYGRRFVGAVTLGVFVFGVVGFSVVNVKVASADAFTYVEDVNGAAVVYRDDKILDVQQNMVLEKGDKVVTENDSSLSIKFFNRSVARLGEGTSVVLDGVGMDAGVSARDVLIDIEDGVVWSRVLNLINGDSSFTVKAGDIYASAKKAAFNVSNDQNEVKVEVYSSVVNVTTSDKSDKKVKTGQAAIVQKSSEKEEIVNVVSDPKDDSWVEKNLNQDKVHIAKVEEETAKSLKNSVGVLPENPLYPFKDLKTGVIKLFTFDDVSNKKVDLESAEMKFIEGAVMLKDGKLSAEDAEKVFGSYVSKVEEFKGMIKAVRDSGDVTYADELDVYLKKMIKDRQNDLNSVLPDSPMYVAKQYVFQAELAAASTDAEKTVAKQSQASQKLSEAQDLVESGDKEMAAQAIGDYAKTVSEVKEEVTLLPDEFKSETASVVVNAIKDDKEVLSSIQETSQISGDLDDVDVVAVQVEKLVVEPIANNLEAELSSGSSSGASDTSVAVTKPTQRDGQYGVPVVGTGVSEKPLDPLLDLNR